MVQNSIDAVSQLIQNSLRKPLPTSRLMLTQSLDKTRIAPLMMARPYEVVNVTETMPNGVPVETKPPDQENG